MSLSLNINNFCENEGYTKCSSVYDNLDDLFVMNKDFLGDNFNGTECHTDINDLFDSHCRQFTSVNGSTNDDNLSQLNKISNENRNNLKFDGPFNVFNKCVFFTNSHEFNKNNILNLNSGNVCNSFEEISNNDNFSLNSVNGTGNINSDQYHHRHHQQCEINSIVPKVPDKHLRSTNARTSELKDEQQSKNSFDLYFTHNNELKPIISPKIKSGVYRKVHKSEIVTNNEIGSNVYLTRSDSCGKVMTLEEFQKHYIIEDDVENYSTSRKNKRKKDDFINETFQRQQQDSSTPFSQNSTCSERKQFNNEQISNTQNEFKKIAYEILNLPKNDVAINKAKTEIIYRNLSNRKRLKYRIVDPKSFIDLESPNQITRISNDNDNLKNKDIKPLQRRGRPRKMIVEKSEKTINEKQIEQQKNQNLNVVTRYGRISKFPTHFQDLFKVVPINEIREQQTVAKENKFSSSESERILQNDDIKDKDFKCDKQVSKVVTDELIQNCDKNLQRKQRNVPSEYQCKVCNKIFLGNRMKKHYDVYPEHNLNGIEYKLLTEMSLYKFLVKKSKLLSTIVKSNVDRVQIFLNELSDLVEQLQLRNSRLLQNTSVSDIHFVNSNIAKILDVQERHYHVNIDEIDTLPDPLIRRHETIEAITNTNLFAGQQSQQQVLPSSTLSPSQSRLDRLDYNLSISLDDAITDSKLNMITSDDSLLRTVNDLMEEGIKNLTDDVSHMMDDAAVHPHSPPPHSHHHHHQNSSSVIHYDHASDNAVEAVSIKENHQPSALLDLSLDLFQFNSD